MIPYIGDISKVDAHLLAFYAKQSTRIVEYGVGGSTMVLRHYSEGTLDCFETEPNWINVCRGYLVELGITKPINFHRYDKIKEAQVKECDLIFVDGADEWRLGFAIDYWPRLVKGGVILFHDTRRDKDVSNVAAFIQTISDVAKFFRAQSPEIDVIRVNENGSNITSITKGQQRHYEDWNTIEGRSAWECGYDKIDIEAWRKQIAMWKADGCK